MCAGGLEAAAAGAAAASMVPAVTARAIASLRVPDLTSMEAPLVHAAIAEMRRSSHQGARRVNGHRESRLSGSAQRLDVGDELGGVAGRDAALVDGAAHHAGLVAGDDLLVGV